MDGKNVLVTEQVKSLLYIEKNRPWINEALALYGVRTLKDDEHSTISESVIPEENYKSFMFFCEKYGSLISGVQYLQELLTKAGFKSTKDEPIQLSKKEGDGLGPVAERHNYEVKSKLGKKYASIIVYGGTDILSMTWFGPFIGLVYSGKIKEKKYDIEKLISPTKDGLECIEIDDVRQHTEKSEDRTVTKRDEKTIVGPLNEFGFPVPKPALETLLF